MQAAYTMMIGEDKDLAMKVAKAWSVWESRCATLLPNHALVDAATDEQYAWTLARHEAHFIVNNCFLADNQILANCDKIENIPTTIVHGRYDIVCPFDNAWLLHQQLPQSSLIVSDASGHASSEKNTKHHLIAATQKMLSL